MDEFTQWMTQAAFSARIDDARAKLRAALDPDRVSDQVVDDWVDHLVQSFATICVRSLSRDLSATLMIRGITVTAPMSDQGQAQLAPIVAELGARFEREYAEGVRLLDLATTCWFANAAEFHERFDRHKGDLVEQFGAHWSEPIASVRPGAGDRHNGGRAVVIVASGDGHKLAYKPRPMEPEVNLDRLLAAVADAVGDSTWQATGVVKADGYGYMNFVEHCDCADLDAVKRFYSRAGMLLAIAHAIGMHDLHTENIIAAGDTPVVIDAETLLPARCRDVPGVFNEPGSDYFLSSVLSPGLLPRWAQIYRQRVNLGPALGYELGGLGRPELIDSTVLTGVPRSGEDDANANYLFETGGVTNLPTIDGVPVPSYEHVDDVVLGFTSTVDALVKWRDEWLAPGGPLAAVLATTVRVIPRNTSLYASAINASLSARCLRSREVREETLRQRLGRGHDEASTLVANELRTMVDLDVPIFHAEANSAVTIAGQVALVESPAAAAARRLDALAPTTLRSVEIIRASLTVPVPDHDKLPASDLSARRTSRVDRDRVVTVINEIADTIADQAILGTRDGDFDGRVPTSWLSHYRDHEWQKSVFTPLGPGLMQGTLGIAVFLAQVSHRLGRPDLRPLAEGAAWNAVRVVVNQHADASPDTGAITDIGFSDGLGGVLWALSELSELWGDPELLEVARGIAAMAIPSAVPRVVRADFAGGVGGALMGVRRLQRATSRVSPQFATARETANELLESLVHRASELIGDGDEVESFAGEARMDAATGTAGLCFALASVAGTHREAYELAERLAGGLNFRRRVGGWEHGTTGIIWAANRLQEAGIALPDGLQDDHDHERWFRLLDGARTQVPVHGLSRGLAGILDVTTTLEHPYITSMVTALADTDRLRLVASTGSPVSALTLGEGLAGVGYCLLRSEIAPEVSSPLG